MRRHLARVILGVLLLVAFVALLALTPAWAADTVTPEGVGIGILGGGGLITILAGLLRRQEMGELLAAFAGLIKGQSTKAAAATSMERRLRIAVGLAQDPDDPPPGSGLLVDVAGLKDDFAEMRQQVAGVGAELAGLRKAVEAGNALIAEALASRVAREGGHADR